MGCWPNPPHDSLIERVISSVAVPICLGSLLAQALDTPRGFRALYAVLGKKWSAPAMTALLMLALFPLEPVWPLAWTAVALLVGACVIREDHALAPDPSIPPLAFISVVSYGMYLLIRWWLATSTLSWTAWDTAIHCSRCRLRSASLFSCHS